VSQPSQPAIDTAPRLSADVLMPFGLHGTEFVADEHHRLALERAGKKLSSLRCGQVQVTPLGALPGRTSQFVGFVLVCFLFAFSVWVDLGRGPWSVLTAVQAIPPVILGGLLLRDLLLTQANPAGCFRLFAKLISKRDYETAYRLVVPNDMDGSLRKLPARKPGSDEAQTQPIQFPLQLKEYWQQVLPTDESRRAALGILEFELQALAPDLDLAVCKLRVRTGTRLRLAYWNLFRFCYRIVFGRDDDRVSEQVVDWRKLLYRQGKKYYLFNAEFQGPEEVDLSWLGQVPPPAGASMEKPRLPK